MNRFRRTTRRWPILIVGLLLVWFLGVRPLRQPSDAMLDPRDHVLQPGVYRVLHVNDDASIDVSVPTNINGTASVKSGVGNSTQRMRIRLLGIALSNPLEAAGQLRERIDAGQQQVRLRFDRRRLDDTGTLLAYVFVDDILLNEELVRLEFADPDTHPTDSGPMIRRISAGLVNGE